MELAARALRHPIKIDHALFGWWVTESARDQGAAHGEKAIATRGPGDQAQGVAYFKGPFWAMDEGFSIDGKLQDRRRWEASMSGDHNLRFFDSLDFRQACLRIV
jgi:hypothetical protein